MEFHLFEASNGECPYLEGREWVSYLIQSQTLDKATYEALLNQGFRRSGGIFYKNKCSGCAECVSLRIPVREFAPSKSQRKIWNRNQDLEIQIKPSEFGEEAFQLYVKFTRSRYQNNGTVEEFKNFLANSQFDTRMMEYRLQGKLVGVGWLDLLANSLSSVYFAFDPDYERRSLGTYSIMKEIELCHRWGLSHLHLGFWVEDCQAMNYKNRFKPYQLLVNGRWVSP